MKTEIAMPDDKQEKIDIGEGDKSLAIRRLLMDRVTNKAGVEMWKYRYWRIEADETYYITEPEEHHRIVRALNNPNVRFVSINNSFVNIHQIKVIKEKVGYKRIQ